MKALKHSASTADGGVYSDRKTHWLWYVAIGVIVFISLLHTYHYYFWYDDFDHLYSIHDKSFCRMIHTFILMDNPGEIPMSFRFGSTFAYFFQYRLFGIITTGYQTVTLLFHVINTLLVLLLLNTVRPGRLRHVLWSLLYGFHPALTTHLALTLPQENLMQNAAALGILILYFKTLCSSAMNWKHIAVMTGMYALGLSFKEQIVMLIVSIAAAFLLMESETALWRRIRWTIVLALPALVLTGIYAVQMLRSEHFVLAGCYGMDYAANALTNTMFYTNLSLMLPEQWPGFVILAAGSVVGVALIRTGRDRRLASWGILHFYLALIPVLGFAGHHYGQYLGLALPGFLIAGECLYAAIWKQSRSLGLALAVIMIGGFGYRIVHDRTKEVPNNYIMRVSRVSRSVMMEIGRWLDLRPPDRQYQVYFISPDSEAKDPFLGKCGDKAVALLFPDYRVRFHSITAAEVFRYRICSPDNLILGWYENLFLQAARIDRHDPAAVMTVPPGDAAVFTIPDDVQGVFAISIPRTGFQSELLRCAIRSGSTVYTAVPLPDIDGWASYRLDRQTQLQPGSTVQFAPEVQGLPWHILVSGGDQPNPCIIYWIRPGSEDDTGLSDLDPACKVDIRIRGMLELGPGRRMKFPS